MEPIQYIREFAKEYAEEALSERGETILKRYRDHNSLKIVRPPVVVFEIPWGEFAKEEELQCKCEDNQYHGVEYQMRSALFQIKHFGGDFIVHPYYRVGVGIMHHESGIAIKEKTISSNTGTYVMAHEYEDVLPDYESLEKIQMPAITLNNEITENRLEFADKIFNGIMPYKKCGYFLNFATWDRIAQYRGVENSLMDLYERPEFIHAMVEKFTQVCESTIDQYEKLNALDTDPYYIGTSPSPTYELPYKDIDKEIITRKDAWVRVMAQMFSTVSPEMHDEFDFRYTQRLFEGFGLSYYGCCEPLDNKIGLMKKRFKNLRKVSITPWANVENAAEQLGSDYILSYKPNPSFVAGVSFDPEPVVAELEHVIKTCLKYNTPLEFILKDISTTGKGNYHNLTQWMETANKVIDKFY